MPAHRTRDAPLEVTTDSPPQPPTLSIIAPTPRAFTFPSSHNLSDSPFSSPSSSPFEPDLRHSLLCSTPPSVSPDLSDSTPSPSSPNTQHKRRKSSSSDAERRPKKGDEDYIKRPENAFILFRRKCVEDRQAAQEEAAAEGPTKKQRQADLSKMISQQWKGLSAEDRQYWENLAKEKKKVHEQMYPDYVYRPQRVKKGKGKKALRERGDEDGQPESVAFILPVTARQHGRSASAPTPPPYQSFSVPNIYAGSGSCPTSPSLLPMISRRAAHTGNPEDLFDYLPPQDSLMPPPTFGMGQYEPHDFMRSMYGQPMMSRSEANANLPPLSVPNGHGVYPQQMISPASSISSSSGPSSPNSGPFTPTTGMLADSFSQLNAVDQPSGCEQISQEHLQMQMYQQQQQDIDLAGYAWESNCLWPADTDILLAEDFDISSIPPIELGIPKFDEQAVMGGQPQYEGEYSQQPLNCDPSYNESQLAGMTTGFDDMMAGNGFSSL